MIDQKFKFHTLVSYFGQVGVIACGFAFTTLVTKFAGISVLGMLGVLAAFSSVLTNLLTFRTNEAVVMFFKRGESEANFSLCKFALLMGFVLDAMVGGGIGFLVYFNASSIATYLLKEPESVNVIRIFAFTLFFQFFRGAPLGYLMARERFVAVNLINMTEHVSRLIWIALPIYATGSLNFSDIILAGNRAALLVSALAYCYWLWTILSVYWRVSVRFSKVLLREYLAFSASSFFSTMLKAGNQNVDTLVLGWLVDHQIVGLYVLFRQFLAPLAFLSNPFAAISYPKFVQAVLERRRGDILNTVATVNRNLAWAYLIALSLIIPSLAIYAWWIARELHTSDYALLGLMASALFLNGLNWWARPFANAIDPWLSIQGNLLATIFLLVLIYPATLYFSVIGTASVMLMLNILITLFWRRKLNLMTRMVAA